MTGHTRRFAIAMVTVMGVVTLLSLWNDRGDSAPSTISSTANSTWTPTGALTTTRHTHTATLLSNGKVLVVGGFGNGRILASAELLTFH